MRGGVAILVFVVICADPALAQSGRGGALPVPQAFSLRGTHSVVFNAGYWAVSSRQTQTDESQAGGFVASISHRYWLTDRWAVGPFVSILDTGVQSINAQNGNNRSVLLTSILFGVDYAVVPGEGNINVIFYLSISGGPYMSTTARTSADDTAASVTALGLRPQIGLDWYLNEWLIFEFAFGYHVVSDFNQPVGTDTNYSGMEFSMGLGLSIRGGQ